MIKVEIMIIAGTMPIKGLDLIEGKPELKGENNYKQ
ncbi:hypothetical protein Mefer_0168 [Methanocaldococcus fervens AG86]|uniref:Uncharacterized protein n=1 Tax=Methanocaldococcus fervens (strain DSM 4213 / JCM 15782 / AG86) TaxID=573064 RepID=C7P625_METFA|nr:hypothetical protein Mefer_0168 [Methanocaldococcus fervens AG86]